MRVSGRTSFCPVGAHEKIENGIHIQSRGVVADGELSTVGFDHLRHAASLSHHGIIADVHVIARALLFGMFSPPEAIPVIMLEIASSGRTPPRNDILLRRIMLKPIRWNTFIKDFLRIQVGFFLFGLAITLMIRGNIGTSAWAVLEVALAQKIGISIGTMTVLMGFWCFRGVIMREN